jgi:hypothetical protein
MTRRLALDDKDELIMSCILDQMRDWVNGNQAVFTYGEILNTWGKEFKVLSWRGANEPDSSFLNSIRMFELRERFVKEFGFVIPCAELLDELAKSTFVLEVGAGSGYMTRLMKHRGIPVIGTDPHCEGYRFELAQYDSGQYKLQGKTAVRKFSDADTVFCSWPTYDHIRKKESRLPWHSLCMAASHGAASYRTTNIIKDSFGTVLIAGMPGIWCHL